MFLKNCWYVAAEPHEITSQPFGRTICNEKIVFWRTEDGDPVAFEDRCCHRRMPLRKGSVQGNILSCHYHGLQFDVTGKCVHVPGPDDDSARRAGARLSGGAESTTGSGSGWATRRWPMRA